MCLGKSCLCNKESVTCANFKLSQELNLSALDSCPILDDKMPLCSLYLGLALSRGKRPWLAYLVALVWSTERDVSLPWEGFTAWVPQRPEVRSGSSLKLQRALRQLYRLERKETLKHWRGAAEWFMGKPWMSRACRPHHNTRKRVELNILQIFKRHEHQSTQRLNLGEGE